MAQAENEGVADLDDGDRDDDSEHKNDWLVRKNQDIYELTITINKKRKDNKDKKDMVHKDHKQKNQMNNNNTENNLKIPKKTHLHINCRHIESRRIFNGYFTAKDLQKAGFVGIRNSTEIIKAKNLIEASFYKNSTNNDSSSNNNGATTDAVVNSNSKSSNESDSLNCDIIIDTYSSIMNKQKKMNDSSDDSSSNSDHDDDSGSNNNDKNKNNNNMNSDYKSEELMTRENDVLFISITKEDTFMRLECNLILYESLRKETDILKEIIDELKNELRESTPKGMIVMWSGQLKNLPKGWYLCNGKNGTPDLTSRFIIGANGNSLNIGDVGGTRQHRHDITVNGHQLTIDEMPQHNHKTTFAMWRDYTYGKGDQQRALREDSGDETKWSSCEGGNKAHSHTASSSNANHMPPYFALAFIMKM